jgi:hypothetical protein
MDRQEIQQKVDKLNATLVQYRSDLGTLEKELLKAIDDYHAALKEEKLKMLKQEMMKAAKS